MWANQGRSDGGISVYIPSQNQSLDVILSTNCSRWHQAVSSTVVLCSKNLYPPKTNFWLRPWSLGTPVNINGFRVLAALLHCTLVVGVSQTAALNRGRHLYSTGRPSCWALAHISSCIWFNFCQTAKRRITQTTPHDSPGTVTPPACGASVDGDPVWVLPRSSASENYSDCSFLMPNILAKLRRGHPQRRRHVQAGYRL